MIRQLVIPILLFSCLINTIASKAPKPNPDCPTKCGNVSIPFPFGIREGCYVDEWFEVVCENSSTSPRPILKRINLEVIRIDFYDGTLDVRFPITFWNCGGGKTPQENRSLKGSPFAFAEDKNKFIAVGCEGHATISSEIDSYKPIVAGCWSVCDNNVSVDTRCNGVNCCWTSSPRNCRSSMPILTTPQAVIKTVKLQIAYTLSSSRKPGSHKVSEIFPLCQ